MYVYIILLSKHKLIWHSYISGRIQTSSKLLLVTSLEIFMASLSSHLYILPIILEAESRTLFTVSQFSFLVS